MTTKKKPIIPMYASGDLKPRIQAAARRAGLPVSTWMRREIEKVIKRDERKAVA